MKNRAMYLFGAFVVVLLSCAQAFANAKRNEKQSDSFALKPLVQKAIENDSVIKQWQYRANSMKLQGLAVETLPNPKLGVTMQNIPIDSFSIGQEPMTQSKIEYSQIVPRGDSLKIKRLLLELQAKVFEQEIQIRKLEIKKQVTDLWIRLYRNKQTIKNIEQSLTSGEQLVSIAQSRYSHGLKASNQSNIIYEQIQLAMFENKLSKLAIEQQKIVGELEGWIKHSDYLDSQEVFSINLPDNITLPTIHLPQQLIDMNTVELPAIMAKELEGHPQLKKQKLSVDIARQDKALVEQESDTQWTFKASYGYRANSTTGDSRSDLASIGIGFDLPIMNSEAIQNKASALELQESVAEESVWNVMKQFLNQVEVEKRVLGLQQKRLLLIKDHILPKFAQQIELKTGAYHSDKGAFSRIFSAHFPSSLIMSNHTFWPINLGSMA
jgi:outer membrane protein TolC